MMTLAEKVGFILFVVIMVLTDIPCLLDVVDDLRNGEGRGVAWVIMSLLFTYWLYHLIMTQ